MANVTKASSLLRCLYRPHFGQVRHKRVRQYELDKDFSWAGPILERHLAEHEGRQAQEKEISKLHLVTRFKPIKGRPWWEREICEKFGLMGKLNVRAVLKNSPGVNEDLTRIAHLVKIVPVTFPHGLPENEEDYEHCELRDNGEFVVKKKIEPVIEDSVAIDTDPKTTVWDMDQGEITRHSRKKLDNWDVNSEYFTPEYVYKHNQDGKEYRYFGDKSMKGKRKSWY